MPRRPNIQNANIHEVLDTEQLQNFSSSETSTSVGGSIQQTPPRQSPRNAARSPQAQSSVASATRASTRHPPPRTVQSPRRNQSAAQNSNATGSNRRKPAQPKKHYYTKIIREIKHYQKTTNLLIPRAPFSRTVREVLQQQGDYRMTPEAFNALQESAETYLVHLLEDANRCTLFRGRVTLLPKDIQLVQYIRNGIPLST
ncbi:histone H3-like [Lutzomyia longipalpis]|uniref:histone H3-like n=1 Tax=Lutzomyia longipalpis TaxID=7200 RepID=UPI0024839690|nr:histone H3-like [Lutzomyia longipalpis]